MTENELFKLNLNDTIDVEHPVVLSLSGGVDSMVLYHVLKQAKFKLVIAHVNHKIRQASDDECNYLKEMANQEKIPFEGHVIDKKLKGNFQDAARNVRFTFLSACAKKHQTNQVVLAHHLDDQVETYLMRLIEGSPLQNLTGMSKVSTMNSVRVIRPLLDIPKSTIEAYAKEHNIKYFQDVTNTLNHYKRNRIRHKIIPEFINENPNVLSSLKTHINQLNSINVLIDDLANQYIETWPNQVPIEQFLSLSPLIQERILRHLIHIASSIQYNCSQKLINQLIDLIQPPRKNTVHPIGNHLNFHLEYDHFFICSNNQLKPPTVRIDELGEYQVSDALRYIISSEKLEHKTSNQTSLWYNDKVFPLYIRPRQAHDKLLCAFGHKKIKDLLIENKIPPSQRERLLMLTNDKEVLWIPFLKLSKHYSESEKKHLNKLYVYEVTKC